MKKNYISILRAATLFLFTMVFIFPQIVSAERYQGPHRGVRPLGMGGAFTAVADDHNSIYYNPAGLAQAGSFGLGILDPYIAVSEDSLDLMEDFEDADTDDTAEVNNLLRKYVGQTNNFRIAADFYTGFKVNDYGVMVSAIGQTDTNVSVQNPVWPEAHITSIVDYGVLVGVGRKVPMVEGLKVGAALKVINRESLDEVYTALDIADEDEDFADKIEDDMDSGTGVSMDIGVLYSVNVIPFTALDLGFTGQNIPEMNFGSAVDRKTQFNAGAAFRQKFGIVQLTESIDYMDITDNLTNDNSIEKKLHLGVEAKIPVLSVRAGLSQGYYTAGATVNLWVFRLDVATFGEEVGVYAGQKEDRQYAAQLSMGWSW